MFAATLDITFLNKSDSINPILHPSSIPKYDIIIITIVVNTIDSVVVNAKLLEQELKLWTNSTSIDMDGIIESRLAGHGSVFNSNNLQDNLNLNHCVQGMINASIHSFV